MEIKKIEIENNRVYIIGRCNICGNINTHNITHATEKKNGITIIDFENLGSRTCHNFGTFKKTNCYNDYELYINKFKE